MNRSFAVAAFVLGIATALPAKPKERPVGVTLADQQAAFNAALQNYIGTDINDLIRRIGPPERQYQMPNGNMVYQFDKSWPGHVVCVVNFEADQKGIILYTNVIGCVA